MQHLDDMQIIRLVAGDLLPGEADTFWSHIADCPDCARRVGEQERLWRGLAVWQAPSEVPDVVGRALRELDRAGRARPRAWWPVGRIAAGLLLGIGVGHAAGRWASAGRPALPELVPVTVAEVVEALGLDVLAAAPVGLADAVDGEASALGLGEGNS